MIPNKFSFIHVRNHIDRLTYSPFGGKTYVWYVNDDEDIIIGNPAICYHQDRFVKRVGRELALNKLLFGESFLLIIPKQVYVDEVIASLVAGPKVSYHFITPSVGDEIQDLIIQNIQNNPINTLSSSWFETMVRQQIARITNDVNILI